MPNHLIRRLRAEDIKADTKVLEALRDIPGYTPSNPDYSLAAFEMIHDKMMQNQQTESRTVRALATDQDNSQLSEWDHHEVALGVKDQIIAQFGPDSHEVQAIGLKKKSERKRSGRRSKKSEEKLSS